MSEPGLFFFEQLPSLACEPVADDLLIWLHTMCSCLTASRRRRRIVATTPAACR